MSMAGIQMTHIPYKGIAPAITAQLANEVQVSLTPIAVGMPHAKAESCARWRAGLEALGRDSRCADDSRIGAAGVRSDRLVGHARAFQDPAAGGEPVEPRVRAALDNAEIRRSLVDQGMDPAGGTPEQFGALIKSDMDKWGDIGKRLGVKLD